MDKTSPYSFLQLTKESEAALRGSQVTEKVHFAIFKKIESVSNILEIRRGNIYNSSVPISELKPLDLPKVSYTSSLKNLLNDKLIAQLCIFHYEFGEIKVLPCYISLPLDGITTPQQLYNEILFYSVRNIEKFLKEKEIVKKNDLIKDFELDFKSLQKPKIDQLPSALWDPANLIVPTTFEFLPSPEVITTIKRDLTKELLRQNLFADLFEYGLMPLKKEEFTVRFESADEFLRNYVIKKYKSDPQLNQHIEAILLEESAYYLDYYVPKTTEFSKKIAETIKKYITSKTNQTRFPGMLPIEIIQTVSSSIEENFKKENQNKIFEQTQSFIEKIKSMSSGPMEPLLYLNYQEINQIHPEVFENLKKSKELLCLEWHLQNSSIWIFAYKEPLIFKKIVSYFIKNPDIEEWKLLVLKFLIEKYEEEFPDLFKDIEFKIHYGKLIRKAYIHFMPWYYQIIIFLNFPFFQDKAFHYAKEKVYANQKILKEKNKKIIEEMQIKLAIEKKEKLLKAKNIYLISKIMDKIIFYFNQGKFPFTSEIYKELSMDKIIFYFNQGKFPFTSEIYKELSMEKKEFEDFLKENQFVTFSDQKENQILLYPKILNWASYARDVSQTIQLTLKKNLNPEIKSTLQKIYFYIESKMKVYTKKNQKIESEDPYKKLEKEIKRIKQQEKEMEDLEI